MRIRMIRQCENVCALFQTDLRKLEHMRESLQPSAVFLHPKACEDLNRAKDD